jgi:TonB family protein
MACFQDALASRPMPLHGAWRQGVGEPLGRPGTRKLRRFRLEFEPTRRPRRALFGNAQNGVSARLTQDECRAQGNCECADSVYYCPTTRCRCSLPTDSFRGLYVVDLCANPAMSLAHGMRFDSFGLIGRLGAGLFALIAAQAIAQQEAQEEHGIELFEAARLVDGSPPQYPADAARRGAEGWVEFNFMVDPEGKAYEIYVVDHAGDDAFIGAARKALEGMEYAPARIGGRPVDGSSRLRVEFVMEDASHGARPTFGTRYRRFMSALTEASQTEAASRLDDLEAQGILNNYEDAHLNLARYSYALKYGGPVEQMLYLKAALGESLSKPDFETFTLVQAN